ncbi:hypothetical protein G112A_00276 [Candidatus Nanosynsacchari sp. TM7_G1_3_12Alb]|nr:hypothetical protein G112A_00276 [Candidatus Nanosynsacchari sp. TM7_G1_3_12Alb]
MAYFVSCLSSALVDEPICAVVRDLPPCRRVTIAVSTIDHERRQWSRAFDALVDFSGELDLNRASQWGDRFEYDPHGLVHQLTADDSVRWTDRISYSLQPLTVLIEVFDTTSGGLLAKAEFVRTFTSPSVIFEEWRTDDIKANFYKPISARDRRSVIVIPGAWGGYDWCNQIASLIAAHGRPALALAYFDWRAEDGLPSSIDSISLEYLQNAACRLHNETEVDSAWTGVIGMSKGAEYALAWASHDPDVDELVALSPTLYAWESVREGGTPPVRSSWTYGGRPLPFLRFDADQEFYDSLDKTLLKKFHDRAVKNASHGSSARLPVENIMARTLLVWQESDTLWPAGLMGMEIVRAMEESNKAALVKYVAAPGCGHAIFAAGVPANNVDASCRINGIAQTKIWCNVRRFLCLE